MSDENIEQERKPASVHELAETPFGGNLGQSGEEVKPEETQEAAGQPEPETTAEAPQEAEAHEPTMEEAMAQIPVDYSETFKGLSVGDVVDGVVVHIDREGVLVDVGTKSEGIIRPNELTRDQSLSPEEVVTVGEKIKVFVVEPEGQHGGPILSKKRADFENAWDKVEKAFKEGGVIKAMVTDRVKGGLVVDLGIQGFVPASHVGSGKLKNLDKFVGQSMPFKVIEVDRERRKVVLSNRLAQEEEQESQRKETLTTLKEGQIRPGIVRRITDYGAFIDLGGVDGLLHISEMSWTRINHPSEVVRVGQKLQVMVLRLNLEQGRVSLGLRQILPDPWEDVKRIHQVGTVVKGTVTRLVPFGAFVQVEGGVEGIIPNSELAQRRVNNPEDVVSSGQEVEVKIIDLRPDERRLTLSLRQLQTERERTREETEYRTYTQARPEERTTIGDLIGEQLGSFAMSEPESEKPSKKRDRSRSRKRDKDAEELEAEEMLAEEEFEAEMAMTEPEPEPEPEEAPEAEAETPVVEEPAAGPETEAPAAEEPTADKPAAEAEAEEGSGAQATSEETPEAPVEEKPKRTRKKKEE
jgi:ribosomal protein S1